MILPTKSPRPLAFACRVLMATLVATPCAAETPSLPQPSAFEIDSPPARERWMFDSDPLSRSGPENVPYVPTSALGAPSGITTDWAQRIDYAWGPSPWSVPQMLELFDWFWTSIDQGFACFQGLDVDWAALRTTMRAEIQPGISRGRFAAIMNHLALALRESHTTVKDAFVNFSTPRPGIPLFVVGGWGDNQHFGAGLTPLPDSSLLVYKVASGHPLGLVPGDIVLGYDGVPWRHLYRELLAAQLPLAGWWWGSSPSSYAHSMLMSAGLNWHLFETIDVVKHATGEVVHLPVAPLANAATGPLECTEQLPVPGVPMPDYPGGDYVSWGIVSGTSIGYIYVDAWGGDAGDQFYSAVHTLLTQYQTTGLIFDFRTNYGGNMFLSYPALELLFAGDVPTIGFATRCGSGHLEMCQQTAYEHGYTIHGKAAVDYDRPIAVLTGPGAVSSGDQVAHLLRFHPRARFFGKSTSTAFNAPYFPSLPLGSWYSAIAGADAYRVNAREDYLTHDESRVDEPVWLEPDDVALRVDTVAEAAIQWIFNQPPTCTFARARSATLWPPDHKLEPVLIEGVSDPDHDPVTIVVTSIRQDEPVGGEGDGATCPDAVIADGVARVRRERAQGGNGRAYVVSFTARDGRGGECQGSVRIDVPHDRGIPDPQLSGSGEWYDAVAACEASASVEGLLEASTTTTLSRAVPTLPGSLSLEYRLPSAASVEVALYDAAGRRVRSLLRERQGAGPHRFEWNATGVRSGVYFARVRANGVMMARSVLIVR